MTHRRLPFAFLALLLVPLSIPSTVRADDVEEDVEVIRPVIVVTLAGIERAFDDIDFVMESGERPELADQLRGLMSFANDLKGLARDKPMGFALYLKPGLVPTPVPVGFLPVDGIKDLMETIELGPVVTRSVTGSENQYEIVGPNRSLFVEVRGDYALIANDLITFDDELENPHEIAAGYAKKYDLSLALFVENVPETTREFFLQLLRTSANAELQQRDDEPDATYALRRANGKRTFDGIEMLLTDVKSIVIGWDTSVENKRAVLDFDVELAPDTDLAKLLEESVGKRSLFSPVVDELSPLAVAGSWIADEPGRDTLIELFNVAKLELAKQLNPDATPQADPITGKVIPIEDPLATRLVEPLITTTKAGHMDFFFQFQLEEDRMVLVGGARMLNADDLGAALLPIMQRLSENPEIDALLETSVDSHRGVAIHRIQGNNSSKGEERLYGEPPALYITAGHRALWFAVGGSSAPEAMKKAIDGVLDASVEQKTASHPPFRMVINAQSWLDVQEDANAPPPNLRFREMAEKSFSPGGDSLRVDFRPTENGGRTRVTIEEGFLRLMGMGIGAAYDFGEEQRERFRERRRNRGEGGGGGGGPRRPTRPN